MASEFTPVRQFRETPAEEARNDRIQAIVNAGTSRAQLQGASERLSPYLAGMRDFLASGNEDGSSVATTALPALAGPGSFRLPARTGSPSVDTSEQAVHGAAPGYGPAVTAGQVEREFGTLDDQPGWMNAKQFVQAGADSKLPLEQSKFLLSPERYRYMQDIGRSVDLLGGLHRDRETGGAGGGRNALRTSLNYWDKSDPERTERLPENEFGKADPRLSRNDYWDPNYERFSGAANGFLQFATDPSSGVAGYMKQAELSPNYLRFSAISPHPFASAAAWHQFNDRFHFGDTPIMDIEEVPGEDPSQKAARFQQRLQEAHGLLRNLAPPSPQYVAREALGPAATPAAAFALDTLISAMDPSAVAGATAGLIRRVMDPSAVSRSLLSRLATSTAGEARDQMVPEYLQQSGIHYLTDSRPDRSYREFLTSPEEAEARSQAAHEEAVRQMEIMNQSRPQSISDARTYLSPAPKQYEALDGFNPFML